jgi:hypothetical protein
MDFIYVGLILIIFCLCFIKRFEPFSLWNPPINIQWFNLSRSPSSKDWWRQPAFFHLRDVCHSYCGADDHGKLTCLKNCCNRLCPEDPYVDDCRTKCAQDLDVI